MTPMIHTIRFVLYCILVGLPCVCLVSLLTSAAVYFCNRNVGAVCGEDTLHDSYILERSNELRSSVLW